MRLSSGASCFLSVRVRTEAVTGARVCAPSKSVCPLVHLSVSKPSSLEEEEEEEAGEKEENMVTE